MTKVNAEERRAQLRRAALEYHEFPTPGKISIAATKQLVNQHDLALAYSPGVAAPCEEIVKDPAAAFKYTSRGNLVGVVTNGTAVLGLGDIGPLAGKPVMEGKGVLFKKFSGIDVFDIEPLPEKDPLRNTPNLLVTPHLGFIAEPIFDAFAKGITETLEAWLDQKPTPHPYKPS